MGSRRPGRASAKRRQSGPAANHPGHGRRRTSTVAERLHFETLLSDLSAAFVNVPAAKVDGEIERWLRRIVEFLGIERSILTRFFDEEEDFRITHSYAEAGFTPALDVIPREEVPWHVKKMLAGEVVVLSRLDDIPADAARDKETARRFGVKSAVVVPLMVSGTVIGAMTFDALRRERSWPEDVVRRFRLVGEVFANALARKREEETLRKRTKQIIHHQAVLLKLARMDTSDLLTTQKRITEEDAKTLGVERVSIWFFNEDRSQIACQDLYRLSRNAHEKGLRLQARQYPRYFQALEENRVLAASDAQSDPRTNEFMEGYLKPFGITSMMDVPVWLHGKVVGVVCHEHAGPIREWKPEEQEFAASIADLVSLTLEAAERKRTEEALRDLTGRLIGAQEEERRRIARELHDDLTQRLAVLAIEVGKLEQEMGLSADPKVEGLRRMKEQIVKLSADVHQISRQLHPSILDDLGLVSAMESECAIFSQREGIAVKYEPTNVPADLSKDVALCLYRVTQEALRNIAKHAQAKEAVVTLTGTGDAVLLSIRDQGTGFDPSRLREKPGLGLASMKERVRLIRGELCVDSHPGRGTLIKVRLPLTGGQT